MLWTYLQMTIQQQNHNHVNSLEIILKNYRRQLSRCTKLLIDFLQKQPPEGFCKKRCCLKPATLFKKRLWYRCFPVNFAKFLKATFTEHLWTTASVSWTSLNPLSSYMSVCLISLPTTLTFCTPGSAGGSYELISVHPSVRPFVTRFSQDWRVTFFLIFCRSQDSMNTKK